MSRLIDRWVNRAMFRCHHLHTTRRPSNSGMFMVTRCTLCRKQLSSEYTRHHLSRPHYLIDIEATQ